MVLILRVVPDPLSTEGGRFYFDIFYFSSANFLGNFEENIYAKYSFYQTDQIVKLFYAP